MSWESYKDALYAYEVALIQGEIVAQSAIAILKNYPKDLPEEHRKQINKKFKKISDALEEILKDQSAPAKIYKSEPKKAKTISLKSKSKLIEPAFLMTILNVRSGRIDDEINFTRIIYSQQAAMFFAYFDAFMGDTLRAILKVRPNLLKKDKKISWESLLDLGNWSGVIRHLTETFVYDFGWLNAKAKINFFEEKFGFDLQLSEKEIETIYVGELQRHLIVHNGGRISSEYKRITKKKSLKIGKLINLNHQTADSLRIVLSKTANQLFKCVSKSFFHKSDADLVGFPQYSTDEINPRQGPSVKIG